MALTSSAAKNHPQMEVKSIATHFWNLSTITTMIKGAI
jgi:hypothetical protein